MSHPLLPDPAEQPTVDLWPTAAKAVGIGRTTAYEHADDGSLPFPVLRIAGKLRVPTAALRRLLDLDSEPSGTKVAS